MEKELAELDQKSQEPGFWDDIEKSQLILQKSKNIRNKLETLRILINDTRDLLVLSDLGLEEKDESVFEEITAGFDNISLRYEKLRLQTLLKGEYDKNDAIFTLHAGAGGTEAMDWVQMLLRMFTRWAEKNQYQTRILDFLEGDEAGI